MCDTNQIPPITLHHGAFNIALLVHFYKISITGHETNKFEFSINYILINYKYDVRIMKQFFLLDAIIYILYHEFDYVIL